MPSVTIWHRLEPRPQESTLPRGPKKLVPDPLLLGLQARIRDPMFMLARQWQVGEFLGDDAGSPVQATVATETTPVTHYRPSRSAPTTPLDAHMPLEVRVEREIVALGLRGAVQLGLRFEKAMLALESGLTAAEKVALRLLIAAFRVQYHIDAQPPAGDVPDIASGKFRTVAAGRVTDGAKLYDAAKSAAQSVPAQPIIPAILRSKVTTVLEEFVAYRRSLYAEPDQESAWVSSELHYDFAVGAGATALAAAEYDGGRLEWHSFARARQPLPATPTTAPTRDERTFIPQNLAFRGMPNARWWNFELGETDFGQLDAEHVDLAKMLVIEFALVYGNDWFELPLSVEVGSLSRVTALLVTNTFGERTIIRPTEAANGVADTPWSMFKISGAEAPSGFLFVPPTLATTNDGPDLEDVLFVRDEMAAMAWAIERKVPGPMDAPLDGYEPYLRRMAELGPPATPPHGPGDPDIRYLLGASVPDNWIPLVPVKTPERALIFRRGVMEMSASGAPAAKARGRVLEPEHPLYVLDEAIPRAGVRVVRYFRRVRWFDGSTWTWVARRLGPVAHTGASGLAFDALESTVAGVAR